MTPPETDAPEGGSKISSALDKISSKLTQNKKFEARRERRGKFETVIYKGTKKVKKPEIYSDSIQYNFLQYIRTVLYWATKDTGLNRSRVELLLYLYPIGLFKRTDFRFFTSSVRLKSTVTHKEFLESGWIVEWRETQRGARRRAALYTLSPRAKKLCSDMHKMCVGEMDVPNLKGVTKDNITSKDRYYMSIIKRMNDKRKAASKG